MNQCPTRRRSDLRPAVEWLEDRALLSVATQLININSVLGEGSFPAELTDVNGTLFFTAFTPGAKRELWKSDGTVPGTVIVKDISTEPSNPFGSLPFGLTNVNGTLFFVANDDIHGFELWKSDGTPGGTTMVKDITPGPEGSISSISELTAVGNKLYFAAPDEFGNELWVSDGTELGTVRVSNIAQEEQNPSGVESSFPQSLTNVNGTLFFIATDQNTGFELYKVDPVSGLVSQLKDIYPGEVGSSPDGLTNVNGTLFFSAVDPEHSRELWKSNGTPEGTVLVKDIRPTFFPGSTEPRPSDLRYFVDFNGTLYFSANGGTTADNPVSGNELWKSNGTPEGTVLVKDIAVGFTGVGPRILTVVDNTLFFIGEDGEFGEELFRSDGTAAGTGVIKDMYPGVQGAFSQLGDDNQFMVSVNSKLYFNADDGTNGVALWRSNGTPDGTLVISDVEPGNTGSGPRRLTRVNNKLFFTADDGTNGEELWVLDSSLPDPAVSASLVGGKILMNAPSGVALDLLVTLDAGTSEIVVASRMSGMATTEFRFPAASVTVGLEATLGPLNDRFDSSALDLPVTVFGGSGNDSLTTGAGSDLLSGNEGQDSLVSGGGSDQLLGGNGNDTLTSGAGTDSLDGGGGIADILMESTTTNLALSSSQLTIGPGDGSEVDDHINFEKAILLGGGAANVMNASNADIPVSLFGGGGNDVLIGSNQADYVDGQGGNDTLSARDGNDTLNGAAGIDVFRDVAYSDFVPGEIRNLTLSNSSFLVKVGAGTLSTDSLLGFEVADITGGGMRDLINASGFTSTGVTTISGGGGNDVIVGTAGADMIFTLTGADSILGGGGSDSVFSGSGNDTISGGAGADNLNGQNGNDSIVGDADNDILIGGAGHDTLSGNVGNDFLSGQDGVNQLFGNEGNDTLQGGGLRDLLFGEAGDDRLFGLQGDDDLDGGDGADSLIGAVGADSLTGGTGADTLQGDLGSDTLDGGADFDRINEVFDTNLTIVGSTLSTPSFGTDSVVAVERIQVSGGAANNFFDARQATVPVFLAGAAGNDTLLGGSKADGITGGDGDDVLSGGGGADVLDGGPGTDYVLEKANADFTVNGVTITSSATGTDTPTTIERIVLIGGAGANKLDASLASIPVILLGAAGNDTLLGGSGADSLSGGSRNDSTVAGSDGLDSLNGGAGSDVLENDAADTKVTGAGDTLVSDFFSLVPAWVDAI